MRALKLLSTSLLAASLTFALTGCDDDTDDTGSGGNTGGATGGSTGGAGGAVGGTPMGGGMGGTPMGGEPVGGEPVGGEPVGGEPVGGEPMGGEGGEFSQACIDACTVLADCSQESDACPGIGDAEGRDAFYQGCLPACEGNPALRALVNGDDCDGTITTLRGLNPDYDAACTEGEGEVEPFTAEEVQELYNNTCSPCHIGGGQSGGLSLDDHVNNTVGVPSAQSDLNLIEAGSFESSYILHKLVGTHADVGGSGQQMPMGGAPWSDENIARFTAWINSL